MYGVDAASAMLSELPPSRPGMTSGNIDPKIRTTAAMIVTAESPNA